MTCIKSLPGPVNSLWTRNERGSNVKVKALKRGDAPNHPGKSAVSEAVIKDAKGLIGSLKFEELRGPTGTIEKRTHCRIDRQPTSADAANIQVQINEVHGHSSVATCAVDAEVFTSMAKWPPGLREHQENWLQRQIRAALNRSLDEGSIYLIVGSFADQKNPRELMPRKRRNYHRSQ